MIENKKNEMIYVCTICWKKYNEKDINEKIEKKDFPENCFDLVNVFSDIDFKIKGTFICNDCAKKIRKKPEPFYCYICKKCKTLAIQEEVERNKYIKDSICKYKDDEIYYKQFESVYIIGTYLCLRCIFNGF